MSKNTILAYSNDLYRYIDFLYNSEKIRSINEIYYANIKNYITQINFTDKKTKINKKFKGSSLNRYISCIRSYHQYLYQNKLVLKDESHLIKQSKSIVKIPDTLLVEEIDSIINAIDMSKKYALRDKAILTLLYASGLRVSELINLKLQSIILDAGFLRIMGKSSKERLVPIGSFSILNVKNYLNNLRSGMSKKGKSNGFLFLNKNGSKLSRMAIWNIINHNCIIAGVNKKVSPHVFRHSFATHLIEGGADLRAVQEMLGHTDISTTQIYANMDKTYLKEIHKQYHPRG